MPVFYSIADAAEQIGVHRSTIIRTAHRLNLGRKVGRTIIFSAAEMKKLRKSGHFCVGNPNFGKTLK